MTNHLHTICSCKEGHDLGSIWRNIKRLVTGETQDGVLRLWNNNVPVLKKISIKKQSETVVFPLAKKPATIELDPRKVLLANIELIKIE